MRGVLAIILLGASSSAFGDEVRISHVRSSVVLPGSSLVCGDLGDPPGSLDMSYWHSYTLSDFGISSDVLVRRIEFGIELLALPSRDELRIDVNLYLDEPQSRPTIGLPLLASANITLGEVELQVVSVDVEGVFPQDKALIVEVAVPPLYDPTTGPIGDVFIPGTNALGHTAPTYVSSLACGIFQPQGPDFGSWEPLVMTVIGEALCPADIDEDGALTIFDFLEFQTLFDAGDLRADFDGDGALTIFDFLDFQTAFDAGC